MSDPIEQAVKEVAAVLDSLHIRYVIVGSVALFAHGIYRATADADVLAEMAPSQAASLSALLGKNWYADVPMIERSLRDRRSFNLIHIPTAQKVDLFPATTNFHRLQVDRARIVPAFGESGSPPLPVLSAEDVVLSKLQWFRSGGEVSERQWSDIVGLLTVNQELDWDYLNCWAPQLNVEDLLRKARAESQEE
jgi:hypothetical protein